MYGRTTGGWQQTARLCLNQRSCGVYFGDWARTGHLETSTVHSDLATDGTGLCRLISLVHFVFKVHFILPQRSRPLECGRRGGMWMERERERMSVRT